MQTYTTLRNLYGTYTKNNSSTNLTLGDTLINNGYRFLMAKTEWSFLDKIVTMNTVSASQYYVMPADCKKVRAVSIINGNIRYPLQEITTIEDWNFQNRYTNIQSNIGLHYYVKGQIQGGVQIGVWPIPSQAITNGLEIVYTKTVKDINVADYSTGTITQVPFTTTITSTLLSGATSATLSSSWTLPTDNYVILFSNGDKRTVALTNGSTAMTFTALSSNATATISIYTSSNNYIVVGSGTSWNASNVGDYIRITETNTANGGDGIWYEINSVIDSTHLSLTQSYGGTSISAGNAAYTISTVPLLPEEYQIIPVYYAAAQYWLGAGNDKERFNYYNGLYTEGETKLLSSYGSKDSNPVLVPSAFANSYKNPNNYPIA